MCCKSCRDERSSINLVLLDGVMSRLCVEVKDHSTSKKQSVGISAAQNDKHPNLITFFPQTSNHIATVVLLSYVSCFSENLRDA